MPVFADGTPAPAAKPSAASTSIPDYGGRPDAGTLGAVGADAPNPVAQAGRSLLALIVVLGGVVGIVFLLKRTGYSGGPVGMALAAGLRQSAQASSTVQSGPLTLLQSQTLPGGGAVHLLSVSDKTLVLVGATTGSVALLAEWEEQAEAVQDAQEERPVAPPRSLFAERLAQLQVDEKPAPASNLSLHNGSVSDILSSSRTRPAQEKPE